MPDLFLVVVFYAFLWEFWMWSLFFGCRCSGFRCGRVVDMAAVEERNGDGGTGWVLALPASEGGSYGRRARTSKVLSSPIDSISGRRQTSGAVRRPRGGWTPEEDAKLRKAVSAFEGQNWKKIAESFPDRTEAQCLHRWQKVLDPELLKGPWTKEEDETIIDMVKEHGPRKWSDIAKSLRGRTDGIIV